MPELSSRSFIGQVIKSSPKPVSVSEQMVALNPNKQTFIGKEVAASPQPKQTNLYG